MDKKVLSSLPKKHRKEIETLYTQVINGTMEEEIFFNKVKIFLGPVIFNTLFPSNEVVEKDIKTEKLHDIIEYSGINLKEEANQIIKETEYSVGQGTYRKEDNWNKIDALLISKIFIEFVNNLSSARGCNVTPDCYYAIFLGLKRILMNLTEKLENASKIRVDAYRLQFDLKITNDIRRQLWVIEEKEKRDIVKYMHQEEEGLKRKNKKMIEEREDLIIKKKLSNTIALAALGSQNRSWMNNDEMNEQRVNMLLLSLYSPISEKEVEQKIMNRRITIDDLIYVFERDRMYNKCVYTYQLYFKKN